MCGKAHEKVVITKVLTVELHQFKQGTKERGAAWTAIAERLNEVNMRFKVNQKLIHEKFEKIMKDYEKTRKRRKKSQCNFRTIQGCSQIT